MNKYQFYAVLFVTDSIVSICKLLINICLASTIFMLSGAVALFISTYKKKENKINIQSGDIIVFKKGNKVQHFGIICPKTKHRKKEKNAPEMPPEYNKVSTLIRGIRACDLNWLAKRWKNGCFADNIDIYRYNGDNKIIIRNCIGEQARKWFNIAYEEDNKEVLYNYNVFYEDLYRENYNDDNPWSNKLFINDKYLNTLTYIKYGLRKNVRPSLNKGITCYGFAIICIGSAFLDTLLSPYHLKEEEDLSCWPSLKHNDDCAESHAPPIYQQCVNLLNNQKKCTKWDRKDFIKLEIQTCEKKEDWEKPEKQKKWEGLVKSDEERLKKKKSISNITTKIPLSCYFVDVKKVKDEKIIYREAEEKLGGLTALHPKYSKVEDLVQYLDTEDCWDKIAQNYFPKDEQDEKDAN